MDDVGGDEDAWEKLGAAAYLVVAALLQRMGGTAVLTPADLQALGDFRILTERDPGGERMTFRLVIDRAWD